MRPPPAYTSLLKRRQLATGYAVDGDTNPAAYEEDHLLAIEAGGSPTDVRNLWPQSRHLTPGAAEKDRLENEVNRLICTRQISLAAGQHLLTDDWVDAARKLGIIR